MRKSYKTQEAYQTILNRVQSGIYSSEGFLEPEVELAKKLQISRITLRRALEILISEGILEKMPNKGYTVCDNASNLNQVEKNKSILFMLNHSDAESTNDVFHSYIWRGIQKVSRENDYFPILYPYDTETVLYSSAEFFKEMGVGIVSDIVNAKKMIAMKKIGLPLIIVDYAGDPNGYDVITQDNYGAMTNAVKNLKARGAKKIGYLNSFIISEDTDRNLHAEQRLEGFHSGTHKEKFDPNNIYVVETKLEKKAVEEGLFKLFNKGVDAIIFPFGSAVKMMYPNIWNKSSQYLKIISWGKTKVNHEKIIYFGNLRWNPITMGQEATHRIIQRIKTPQLENIRITLPVKIYE